MGRKYPAKTTCDIYEFDTFPSFQCNKLFCTGGVNSHTTVEILLSGTHLNGYTKALLEISIESNRINRETHLKHLAGTITQDMEPNYFLFGTSTYQLVPRCRLETLQDVCIGSYTQ